MVDFLEYVAERRRQRPRLHIYHYASYERTHLVSIAARHTVGEEAVDDLLRSGVLVDLHPIVKQFLRVGSRSYSLKKLEPLYLGTRGRSGVATAVDSITEYVRSRDLIDSGDTDAAARILAEIATCNEYDSYLDLALNVPLHDPDPVFTELAAIVAGFPAGERTADQSALALASAAIDYHRREGESFWWDHYARLVALLEDWSDTRNVFVVDCAEVLRGWGIEGRART